MLYRPTNICLRKLNKNNNNKFSNTPTLTLHNLSVMIIGITRLVAVDGHLHVPLAQEFKKILCKNSLDAFLMHLAITPP